MDSLEESEVRGTMKEKIAETDRQDEADKITSLLQLRAHLEQELRASIRKIEELKRDCDSRRRWIYFLDEMLSEASFQPASALVGKLGAMTTPDNSGHFDQPAADEAYDFDKPINITNPETGTLLSTINFLEGNALVAFNEKILALMKGAAVNEIVKTNILAVIEKEGGKVFLERDEGSGSIRSITGIGTFKTEVKEKIIQGVNVLFSKIRDSGESLP